MLTRKFDAFHIKNVSNAVHLRTELEKETRTLAASNSSTKRSRIEFQEALETQFTGSIYHPKLFKYDLLFEFSPEHQKEDSSAIDGDNKFRSDYLTRYNINSIFLKDKPIDAMLFASKEDRVDNGDFFERQTTESKTYGGRVGLKRESFPSSIAYQNLETDTSRSFRPDFSFDEETIDFQTEPSLGLLEKISINYTNNTFRRVEQTVSDQHGVSDSLTASNRIEFGPDKRYNVSSFFRYYDVDGTNSNKNVSISESMNIKHNSDLNSLYNYSYSERENLTIDSKQHVVNMGLTHQLYESLSSSFRINGSRFESTTFDEDKTGFDIDEDYSKKIGPATLNLGLSLSLENEDRNSASTFLNIDDEEQILNDSQIVFLDETRIDVTSVVVSNSSGTLLFTENVDYQLIDNGSGKIEIRRIPAGSIANGEQVKIDYIVRVNPSFGFTEIQNSYRFRLTFLEDMLKIYYTLKQTNISNEEGQSNFIVEEVDDSIIGARFQKDWITLSAEYEQYESILTPFDALRLSESFYWQPYSKIYFNLSARQDFISLRGNDRETFDIRGSMNYRISPSSVFNIDVGQVWQNGVGIDGDRFTFKSTMRKNLNKLMFEMGYRYGRDKYLGDDLKEHFSFINLKRDF